MRAIDLSIVSYGISYLLFDVAFIVVVCSYYIEVIVTLTTRLGASINVMKKVWLSFYMYILIESMGFLALFVPLFNSNLTCYLIEPSVIQVYTILMSTLILLSSGYLTNIAAWALFTHQTYIIIIARLLCVIAAFSFILIEWHELQTSTPAFNTSCLHSSIVTLEASSGGWGLEVEVREGRGGGRQGGGWAGVWGEVCNELSSSAYD